MDIASEVEVDAVVVGSGAAALSAAIAGRARGLDVLVLEKTEFVGGSTGISGGMVWIPNHPLMRDGATDSEVDALAYIAAVAGDVGPASTTARREAFVAQGPEMIRLWQRLGIPLRWSAGYPDYHSDAPGGSVSGRNLEVELFDLHDLGPWERHVQAGMFAGLGLIGYGTELSSMMYFNQSLRCLAVAAKVQARTWWSRLRRTAVVGNGGALVGRLLDCLVREGGQIWTESPVQRLVFEDGRAVGVEVVKDGASVPVRARRGVVLAAGGFSHDATMRARYGGDKATSARFTMAYQGDTGEVLTMALEAGAATDLMDEAIWVPVMKTPEGDPPPRSTQRQMMAFARSRWRAGSILVDAAGQRFANESMSYRELGQIMYEHDKSSRAIPSWLIFDDDFRRRCVFGVIPGRLPSGWIRDGFVLRAADLAGLASRCGIDARGLAATVERFNEHARTGVDPDFGRGDSAYDRFMAGPRGRNGNPCLAPIRRGPFYATAVYPGDVGTFGGLLTDEHARVLDQDHRPIPGLYGAGNITAPISGRGYFAAGGSIGPAATFGFIAMNHIADCNPSTVN